MRFEQFGEGCRQPLPTSFWQPTLLFLDRVGYDETRNVELQAVYYGQMKPWLNFTSNC